MKTKQQSIDKKAVWEAKATGSDDQGGQDKIDPGQRVNTSDQPPFRKSIMGPLPAKYKEEC